MNDRWSLMLRMLVAGLLLSGIGFAQAQPAFPPGLRVGLEPAGELKARADVAGFQDADRNVTVAIAELPAAAYAELMQAMFGKPPSGMTGISRELFSFRDGVGYLHKAHVVENGIPSWRWLLLMMPAAARPAFVGIVNVNVPDTASSLYSDAVVRRMLASIVIRKPPIDEQLELIPFRLDDLAGFRVTQVTPDSVLVTDGPDDELSRHPYMVVSIGRATPAQTDDRARFSRDLLASTPLRDVRLQSADQLRIGGAPGFEIRGSGQNPSNNDPNNNNVSFVQWVRFLGGGFIRMVGVAPADQWDAAFNRFRAVRDGVALR